MLGWRSVDSHSTSLSTWTIFNTVFFYTRRNGWDDGMGGYPGSLFSWNTFQHLLVVVMANSFWPMF